jgi:hypothetical protein
MGLLARVGDRRDPNFEFPVEAPNRRSRIERDANGPRVQHNVDVTIQDQARLIAREVEHGRQLLADGQTYFQTWTDPTDHQSGSCS